MKTNIEKNDEGNLSKNSKILRTFVLYCLKNPELRFFQALSGWLGKDITVGGEDPFYWEKK
jgi:hypothetical protein